MKLIWTVVTILQNIANTLFSCSFTGFLSWIRICYLSWKSLGRVVMVGKSVIGIFCCYDLSFPGKQLRI